MILNLLALILEFIIFTFKKSHGERCKQKYANFYHAVDSLIKIRKFPKPNFLCELMVFNILNIYRGDRKESSDRILIGTQDGKIGLLKILTDKTFRITWLITSSGSEITSLDTYELDDTPDILIGRQDGTIQVYSFPHDDEINPSLRYQYVSIFLITYSRQY